MKPSLSVVMPTYNGEKYLAPALESVRQQLREGIELVVVDDGSTDSTLEILRDYQAAMPIRLLTPGRLGNWVAASNLGLREANGDWACFLHQDDLWLPGRIARLWPEMERATSALIFHQAVYVGPEGEDLGKWSCPFEEGLVPSTLLIERLLVQNFIAIPSPMFRREPVVRSGGMKEALWFSADWDLWLRLGGRGPATFIPEALAAFRIHPASQTAARKLQPTEWEHQLETVLYDHLQQWPQSGRTRSDVKRAALLSVAVNAALSTASRGYSPDVKAVLSRLLAVGPFGLRRYLRDSRIVERVWSRFKVQRRAASSKSPVHH